MDAAVGVVWALNRRGCKDVRLSSPPVQHAGRALNNCRGSCSQRVIQTAPPGVAGAPSSRDSRFSTSHHLEEEAKFTRRKTNCTPIKKCLAVRPP